MNTQEKIAKILLDIGAVEINVSKPFKYESGLVSPIYVDCRILNSFPDKREIVINKFLEIIKDKANKNFDLIVGAGSSGISLATYVSTKLNIRMAYAREKVKNYGTKKQIEGVVNKGDNAIVVCDILGTEKKIPMAIDALKNAGAKTIFVISIFDMGLDVSIFLKEKKIPFYALTDMKTLLNVAEKDKKIAGKYKGIVDEWVKNPIDWEKNMSEKINRMIVDSKKRMAEILLEIKAVSLNPKDPFRFTSGILSPIYTDNRLLPSFPEAWGELAKMLERIIVNNIGIENVDVIAGTDSAGISHASYVSAKLKIPMIYIKSSAQEHGKQNKIEGLLKKDDKVVVIEDLVSTGGSCLDAVKTVREAGGIVESCLSIFNYELNKSKEAFKEAKCNLYSLTDFSSLVEVAVNKNYINKEDKELVLAWNKDTEGWGERFE